jgi:hypothetical protein
MMAPCEEFLLLAIIALEGEEPSDAALEVAPPMDIADDNSDDGVDDVMLEEAEPADVALDVV